MSRPIWLELTVSDTQHGNVVLTFGHTSRIEDAYYFANDPEARQNDGSNLPASVVMALLIDQWRTRLQELDACYLPCGFADQYVTWIQCCSTSHGHVSLNLGWSGDEGWKLVPSNLGNRTPNRFEVFAEIAPVSIYRPRLLSLLRSNALMLRSSG